MSIAPDDPRDDVPQLPELADDRIDKIEGEVFATIAKERTVHRTRRTRIWIASAAAAVVIVVAAAIAPVVSTLVPGAATDEAGSAPGAPVTSDGSGNPDLGMTEEPARDSASVATDSGAGALGAVGSTTVDREVITFDGSNTAKITVTQDGVTKTGTLSLVDDDVDSHDD